MIERRKKKKAAKHKEIQDAIFPEFVELIGKLGTSRLYSSATTHTERPSDGEHRNSSCASGGSTPIIGSPMSDDAPSWHWEDVRQRFKCKLLVHNGQLTAAYEEVCPPSEGKMVHNVPVQPGFVKCYVNKVLEGFEKTPLYHVNPEGDQLWLADARLLFVQWPRVDIQPLEDAPTPTTSSSTNIAKIMSQQDCSTRLPQTSRFCSEQRSTECS